MDRAHGKPSLFPCEEIHETQCLLRMSQNATATIQDSLHYIATVPTQRLDIDTCVEEVHAKKTLINKVVVRTTHASPK